MLRGAIEIARRDRVSGWLISAAGPLRGETVLAFVGRRCVGSGQVSVFRADLNAPDLGDGFSGFDFPIELQDGEAVESVVIRLELCDPVLVQDGSQVVASSALRPTDFTMPVQRRGAGPGIRVATAPRSPD